MSPLPNAHVTTQNDQLLLPVIVNGHALVDIIDWQRYLPHLRSVERHSCHGIFSDEQQIVEWSLLAGLSVCFQSDSSWAGTVVPIGISQTQVGASTVVRRTNVFRRFLLNLKAVFLMKSYIVETFY